MAKLIKTYPNIKIRPNDFDFKDDVRPSAILDYFQGMAGDHANDIGVGYEELKAKNLAWILAKQKYVIKKNTDMYDYFDATTYPLPAGRIEYDRCYKLESKRTGFLVEGISRWCLVDFTTHRISREKALYNGECLTETNGLEFDKDLIKLNDMSLFKKTTSYYVNVCDLDHYHHMNNTKYGDVILNAIDPNLHIKEFEIAYIKECVVGDVIDAYVKQEGNVIYCFGMNKDQISFKSKILVE